MNTDRRSNQQADLDLFVSKFFTKGPKGLSHGDKPDLTFNLDDKVIGIEHTRMYRTLGQVSGLEPHSQLAVQHRIVQAAWEEYLTLSSRKLWLLAYFEDVTTYKKRDSQAVANLMARVVHERVEHTTHSPGEIIWHELESWRYQKAGIEFPEGVKRISFQIVEDNPELELWVPAHTLMVPHLSVDSVKERIYLKERQIQSYLSKCDEVWLLLVLDTGVPSNHFVIDEDLLATEFRSLFSKIFLFRTFHSELFELKVLGPKDSG